MSSTIVIPIAPSLSFLFGVVLFTGGSGVAKFVAAAAAKYLTPVSLEVC